MGWLCPGVTLPSAVGGRSEPVPGLRAKVHRQVVLQLHVDLGKVKVHPHVGQGGHVGSGDGADVQREVVVHGAHGGQRERGVHEGVRGHPGLLEVLRHRPGDDFDPLDFLHGLFHGRADALEAVLCTGRRAQSPELSLGAGLCCHPPFQAHPTASLLDPFTITTPQRGTFPSVGCGAALCPPDTAQRCCCPSATLPSRDTHSTSATRTQILCLLTTPATAL